MWIFALVWEDHCCFQSAFLMNFSSFVLFSKVITQPSSTVSRGLQPQRIHCTFKCTKTTHCTKWRNFRWILRPSVSAAWTLAPLSLCLSVNRDSLRQFHHPVKMKATLCMRNDCFDILLLGGGVLGWNVPLNSRDIQLSYVHSPWQQEKEKVTRASGW